MCTWVTPEVNKEYMNRKYLYAEKNQRLNEIAFLVNIPANVLSMRMSSRGGKTLSQAIAMGPKAGKSGDTKYFIHNGIEMSLMAVAKVENIRYGNLRRYVNDLNIPIEEAIKKLKTQSQLKSI